MVPPYPWQEEHEEHCNQVNSNFSCKIPKQTKRYEIDAFSLHAMIISEQHTNLPGTELKSPHTNIGISALAAIFSNPFKRVRTWFKKKSNQASISPTIKRDLHVKCRSENRTCQSLTSFKSWWTFICVFAYIAKPKESTNIIKYPCITKEKMFLYGLHKV